MVTHNPSVMHRLYRPRQTRALPPIELPSRRRSSFRNRTLPQMRWLAAYAQIKAVIRMSEPLTRAWGGVGGRLGWRLSVGRPVPPSNALRASSYDRFLGVVATPRKSPRPARCIATPRSRTSGSAIHPTNMGSSLPPVTTCLSRSQPSKQQPSSTASCEASKHPLDGRTAREYVMCAR